MKLSKESFNEIYNQNFDKIVTFFSRTAGSDIALDYAQDVFLKVFSSIDKFDNKSSVYTWIYRIATNYLIDKMRKKKLLVDRCNLTDRELFCKSKAEYLTEEFRIVQDEMNECIGCYIKKLPPKYRAIIVLREYESMPIDEIMNIMNISKENAKKTLLRARKKLKNLLYEQCQFYYNEANQFLCEKKESVPF
jgi:RNA polymerase sigma-70 factor, ECF subfamily